MMMMMSLQHFYARETADATDSITTWQLLACFACWVLSTSTWQQLTTFTKSLHSMYWHYIMSHGPHLRALLLHPPAPPEDAVPNPAGKPQVQVVHAEQLLR
jgi:hypothetical protein